MELGTEELLNNTSGWANLTRFTTLALTRVSSLEKKAIRSGTSLLARALLRIERRRLQEAFATLHQRCSMAVYFDARCHAEVVFRTMQGMVDSFDAEMDEIVENISKESSLPTTPASPSFSISRPLTKDGEVCCCRIGIIADVQWADAEDGWNFQMTEKRCFRGALEVLGGAARWWNEGPPLQAVAQLGDLVDGRCRESKTSDKCLEKARAILDTIGQGQARKPAVLNLIGNHELYNFSREQLSERLGTTRGGFSYYAVDVCRGLKLLVLNGYQHSVLGYDETDERYQMADRMLRDHNPNYGKKGDLRVGLTGNACTFMPYNGAHGKMQLAWFRGKLRDAEAKGDKIIVLSHELLAEPLPRPTDAFATTMAFDHQEISGAIGERRGVVLAVFAGHDHKGAYVELNGVHHITFQSPLNLGADGYAFGRADIYRDRLVVRGPRLSDFLHATALDACGFESASPKSGLSKLSEDSAVFHYPPGVTIL